MREKKGRKRKWLQNKKECETCEQVERRGSNYYREVDRDQLLRKKAKDDLPWQTLQGPGRGAWYGSCETRHRAWETFGTGSDGQTFAVGKLYGLAMCWLFVGVRQLDSRGSMPSLSSSMHPRSSLTPLIFF